MVTFCCVSRNEHCDLLDRVDQLFTVIELIRYTATIEECASGVSIEDLSDHLEK